MVWFSSIWFRGKESKPNRSHCHSFVCLTSNLRWLVCTNSNLRPLVTWDCSLVRLFLVYAEDPQICIQLSNIVVTHLLAIPWGDCLINQLNNANALYVFLWKKSHYESIYTHWFLWLWSIFTYVDIRHIIVANSNSIIYYHHHHYYYH